MDLTSEKKCSKLRNYSCVLFRGLTHFLFLFIFIFGAVYVYCQTPSPYKFNPDSINDKDWLIFSKHNGLTDAGIQNKLPIIKSELDLTQVQIDEIEKLISAENDQELIERTLGNEQEKKNTKALTGLQTKLTDAKTNTLQEVAAVRNLLGKKDLDFRFWLLEERIIHSSEAMAYFNNHNYSPDELVGNVVNRIQALPEFQVFKKIKTEELASNPKATYYFETRTSLTKKRVLFQYILNRHIALTNSQGEKISSEKNQVLDEIAALGQELNSIK